jgi:helicase MOV-10
LVITTLLIVLPGIDPEEIGIIAPYKAQVRAIRELLKVAHLSDISVGSVEQFSGQVWCKLQVEDGQHSSYFGAGTESGNFGRYPRQRREQPGERVRFLDEPSTDERSATPRRHSQHLLINISLVAITRAQALLVVIGDPDVLGKDKLWCTFLDYIESRKGWTGKMHSWKSEEVVLLPGYEIVPGKGDVAYGEEFIGGKSEKIRRSSDGSRG